MRLPATRNVQLLLRRSIILFALILLPYFLITSLMAPRQRNDKQNAAEFLDSGLGSASEHASEDDESYPSIRRRNLGALYKLHEAYQNKSEQSNWEIITESSDNDLQTEHGDSLSSKMTELNAATIRQRGHDFINASKSTEDTTLSSAVYRQPHRKGRDHLNQSFNSLSSKAPDKFHSRLPVCPERPLGLKGKMKQDVLLIPTLKETYIIRAHPELTPGGHWKPIDCIARHKVAIIIPFRDRQSHLNRLIEFLIPMLERQQLDFRFVVTEQYGHDLFNKGKIMNAAFLLAERLGVDCVIFHDVDLFPQDDRNLYGCTDQPLHLGAYVNTLGYELWYNYLAGGVLEMRTEHYRAVNGYSNQFWAWGGEDDDMGYRILAQNMSIDRPDTITGRMTMLKHIKRQRIAPKMIYKLLKTSSVRWQSDGVNSTNEWRVLKVIQKPLYYHMFVDVGNPPKEWRNS